MPQKKNINEELIEAICDDYTYGVLKLLEKGANVNVKDENGYAPLMWAAFYGNTTIVQILIDRGADLDLKTKSGGTALKLAEIRGYINTAKLLKQHGATE